MFINKYLLNDDLVLVIFWSDWVLRKRKKETNKCRSESLYCTPKTNIVLEFNYTAIKERKTTWVNMHMHTKKFSMFCTDTHVTNILYVMSWIEGTLGTVESGGTEGDGG